MVLAADQCNALMLTLNKRVDLQVDVLRCAIHQPVHKKHRPVDLAMQKRHQLKNVYMYVHLKYCKYTDSVTYIDYSHLHKIVISANDSSRWWVLDIFVGPSLRCGTNHLHIINGEF